MRESYLPPSLTVVGSVADLTRENDVSLNPDDQLGVGILGSDGDGGGGGGGGGMS